MSWFGAWGDQPAPVATHAMLGTQPRLQPLGTQPIPTGTLQSGSYAAGEVVEYFSASQGTWIPAKVLAVNANGTYNLDCKPDVTPDKLRRPSGSVAQDSSAAEHQPGERVEYFAASAQKWIPAQVLSVTPTGNYNLDCKPDVPPDRIRKQAGNATASYSAGDRVEYFGATAQTWIAAQVVTANADGTYDLDCKPGVAADKIRSPESATAGYREGDTVEYFSDTKQEWISAKVQVVNGNGTWSLDCKPQVPASKLRWPSGGSAATNGVNTNGHAASNAPYQVGDAVEYFGATAGTWIPAKVTAVNTDGTFNLDCKPDVPPSKIRMPEKYSVGDVIEYNSASQGWIAAKIVAVNGARGTYSLDCKPDVTSDKIRRPSAPGTSTALRNTAAQPEGVYAIGETVEYFGQSQNRWVPTKVVAMNSDGTYHLDCKQQVATDRIRRMSDSAGFAPATSSRMAPFPSAQALATTGPIGDTPVQLLRVERSGGQWRYEVCPEGAKVLERYGSRGIAVASMAGLYRTGKSFLLNLLSERSQKGLAPFKVGGTSRACTEGLWLWGEPMDAGGDKASPLLALIDCEGFGSTESDKTRDAQLMTLCALLSSVLMLNTKGALNEGMFNSLALTCKFAEHVEERGNEANRPALLWILRDFMLELQDAGGRPTTPDEYLEQALHAAPTGHDGDRGQAAREVRQSLLRFFSRRSCATLVQPASSEAELQRLDSVPYGSLRKEFRTGAEALKLQMTDLCRSNPKAVGGQPLSCVSFVALLRQLAAALNDNKLLSVRGAWETVQHTTCGQLADELRGSALESLHGLAAGRQLPGGAQLPMTDEALRAELRSRRHAMKAHWDERAVGDELVREEYWQELKESLAREEALVRQQNTRLADTKLVEALRSWQEWLDNDDSPPDAVDRICRELGQLMDQMPAAPLSRAGRQAIDAAARRVAAGRSAVASTVQQHGELHRKAMEWGEQAAQQEGVVRTQLYDKKSELQNAKDDHRQRMEAEEELTSQLEAQEEELRITKQKLEVLLKDFEAARAAEHDHRAKSRSQTEAESSLQAELEQLRAAAAKANAERLAEERCARASADTASADQRRLEVEIGQAKAEAEKLQGKLHGEKVGLVEENERTKAEHEQRVADVRKQLEEERRTLKGEKEKTRSEHQRVLEETQKHLDEERTQHRQQTTGDQDKHLDRERRAGVLEGQVQALTAETSNLRQKVHDLEEKKREGETAPARLMEESSRAQAAVEKERAEITRVREEMAARLKAMKEDHDRKIAEEEAKLAEKKKKKGGLFKKKGKDGGA